MRPRCQFLEPVCSQSRSFRALMIALGTLSVLVSGTPLPAVKNPSLSYLGFYTCVTPQVGNQCEEGFTLDQLGTITGGFSSNLTTIKAGHAQGNITTLFAIHDTFFKNGAGLREDWKKAWAARKVQLEPLVQSRIVVGFFVGDELFPGKITVEDFTTCLEALAEMKAKYPWLVTWENEGGLGWVDDFNKTGIPADLDIVSLDDYYMWTQKQGDTPQSQVDGHRAFYEASVYPLLKPHQKVFIVPGSFATRDPATHHSASYPHGNQTYCYNGTPDGCDRYMADQAKAFAAWAFEDTHVAGIAPWHWDTRKIGVVSPYKEVGVVEMPKTREVWRQIGEKIRHASTRV